jgi:dolichyl-phosphate-mannose-protein mannosyltransferase
MDTDATTPSGQGMEPADPDIEQPALPDIEVVRVDRSARHARKRWTVPPLLAIAMVTALAGGLRFYRVSAPQAYVFDEVYYAKDGCFDAGYDYRACKLTGPGEQTYTVHPPLGRWIIAGSEVAFGNRPFGWRFASAVAGTIMVALVSLLALRLFGGVLWATAAGLLLATEHLNFVMSRISMVDIFLGLFVVAGFLFLVLDRQWMDRRTPDPPPGIEDPEAALLNLPPDRPPSPILRPWRIATGVAFGAAIATKWSGAPALGAAVVLSLVWEASRRKRFRLAHPWREALRDESFGVFWFLIVIPLAVYVASYGRWWADNGLDVAGWFRLQTGMASYSIHLRAPHPYASRPWTWLIMARPVAYYYQCTKLVGHGCRPAEILGMGNPVIFWGSLLTLPYLIWAGIRKRDWKAGLLLAAFGSQYFAWFLAARTSFLFYMVPITPFMVLAWIYLMKDLSDARIGAEGRGVLAPIAGFVAFASVALFVFFWPILTARGISQAAWNARVWFRSWI